MKKCMKFLMLSILFAMLVGCDFNSKPKEAYHKLDVKDMKHSAFNEAIALSDISFTIKGIRDSGNGMYELIWDISDKDKEAFKSKYTLNFAYDDIIIKKSSQVFEGNATYMKVSDFDKLPTQIVVVQNQSLENLVVINISWS